MAIGTPAVLLAEASYPGRPIGSFGDLPPSSPVDRRIHEFAAALRLVLAPAAYSLTFAGGVQSEERSVSIDALEGPFFVTSVAVPPSFDVGGGVYEVDVQSGSRRLTEGRVRGRDVLSTPGVSGAAATARDLLAPIVVLRGDSLKLRVTVATGAVILAEQGATVIGWSLRNLDGGRVGDAGDKLAALVRGEGEFYACGVVNNRQDSITVSSDVVAEELVFALNANDTNLRTLRAQIGNLDIFPQGLDAVPLLNYTRAVLLQRNLRYPVPGGQRITLTPFYSGGTPLDVSMTMLGRRAVT